ncbi:MAG: glycosyltransferase family 2 protein [Nocardioidaceae bacterium]|nr:glycosyltransferase family 2 protein [Nocardioidaceae bacterium]
MAATEVPDVTVVVAVYNTMPYLTACLESVVEQTLGVDRIAVVAVDDGSTDGSGAELDRFAAAHPGLLTVLRQPNSGGPAAPNNRALEVATGRYVFFLGADDHLGTESLERLVTAADQHDADVVFGRMVGTNDRHVHQKIYRQTDLDLDLYDSELPFALANTKLFRRSLVEEQGLRFPEDLKIGSDQTFTIAALVHSRRTCVLGDYTFYYAVRRHDASNISYDATWRDRLWSARRIMDEVATQLPPGERRDAVLRRHLTWELAKLLREDFLELDEDEQVELVEGVGKLCDTYFTDDLKQLIGVKRRIRLCLAEARRVDLLRELLAREREHGDPPFVAEAERAFAAYPGYAGDRGVPREWYELFDETVGGRLRDGVRVSSTRLTRRGLALEGSLGATPGHVVVGVHLRDVERRHAGGARSARQPEELPPAAPVDTRVEPSDDLRRGPASTFATVVPLERLGRGGIVAPRLRVQLGGHAYDLPVHCGHLLTRPEHVRWHGLRRVRTLAVLDDSGNLVVESSTLGWSSSMRRVAQRLRRRR